MQTLTWVMRLQNLSWKFTHRMLKQTLQRSSRETFSTPLSWMNCTHCFFSSCSEHIFSMPWCQRIHPGWTHFKHKAKQHCNTATSRNASRQPDSFSWLVMYLSISMRNCGQTQIQKQAKGTLSIFPFHQSLVVSHPTCFVPKRNRAKDTESNTSLNHRSEISKFESWGKYRCFPRSLYVLTHPVRTPKIFYKLWMWFNL